MADTQIVPSYQWSSSADALTTGDHPPGCLSIQGGLACTPENNRISEILAAGRAATETALEERLSARRRKATSRTAWMPGRWPDS